MSSFASTNHTLAEIKQKISKLQITNRIKNELRI